MHPIRKLRIQRGLSITELAILSGVAARSLGAAEYGIAPLTAHEVALIEQALQVSLDLPPTPPTAPTRSHWRSIRIAAVGVLVFGLAGMLSSALLGPPDQPTPAHAAAAQLVPTAALVATLEPTATVAPALPTTTSISFASTARIAATVVPATDEVPRGCPLLAALDHVIVTQGYGVGTHAPSSVAGALDLAVDGDGDHYADPAATDGVVVLATHAGVVHLFPNSWPGGNVVRIVNEESGWGTLYAHLATFAVSDGQRIQLGEPIGRVGSTGMADGPHLHYEIWFRGENHDPSVVQGCWR